jgi:hypothetical protein
MIHNAAEELSRMIAEEENNNLFHPDPVMPTIPPFLVEESGLDPDADIAEPNSPQERVALVRRFRQEILRDWINDVLVEHGLGQFRLVGADLDFRQIDNIIRDHAATHGQTYVTLNNIRRHDWHPVSRDLLYTMEVNGSRRKGAGEDHEGDFLGFRYAAWLYWGRRTHNRVRPFNVLRYLRWNGVDGFFRELVWPFLPTTLFLALWRSRRASRRG